MLRFYAISHESATAFHQKPLPKSTVTAILINHIRTVANGHERLRTRSHHIMRTTLYPQTPKVKRGPSLRIREKAKEGAVVYQLCLDATAGLI